MSEILVMLQQNVRKKNRPILMLIFSTVSQKPQELIRCDYYVVMLTCEISTNLLRVQYK